MSLLESRLLLGHTLRFTTKRIMEYLNGSLILCKKRSNELHPRTTSEIEICVVLIIKKIASLTSNQRKWPYLWQDFFWSREEIGVHNKLCRHVNILLLQWETNTSFNSCFWENCLFGNLCRTFVKVVSLTGFINEPHTSIRAFGSSSSMRWLLYDPINKHNLSAVTASVALIRRWDNDISYLQT